MARGRTEDIAHIMGVVGPVGPELELHCEAGRNTQGKVDGEQLAPEFGHVLVDLFAGHHIDRLHDYKDPGHPQRQGNKQEVIKRSCGKLPAR